MMHAVPDGVDYKPSLLTKIRWWLKERWSRLNLMGRIEDAMIRWALRREMNSNSVKFARRELESCGYDLNNKKDDINTWVVEDVLQLCALFARQGHSGMSAPYVAKFAYQCMMFEPVKPLTGEDSEWIEHNYGGRKSWQNVRCSHVFKEEDGRAYDMDGRIFREPTGACYTSHDSRVYIEFPYTPKREYVDVKKYQHEETGRTVRTHLNPGDRWHEVPWETEDNEKQDGMLLAPDHVDIDGRCFHRATEVYRTQEGRYVAIYRHCAGTEVAMVELNNTLGEVLWTLLSPEESEKLARELGL